jgi:hypothetical protein
MGVTEEALNEVSEVIHLNTQAVDVVDLRVATPTEAQASTGVDPWEGPTEAGVVTTTKAAHTLTAKKGSQKTAAVHRAALATDPTRHNSQSTSSVSGKCDSCGKSRHPRKELGFHKKLTKLWKERPHRGST